MRWFPAGPRALAASAVLGGAACAGGTVSIPREPRMSTVEIARARRVGARIPERALDAWARRPRPGAGDIRQALTLSIREGVSGRSFEARGVLAIRPGRALRMVLLGPGGSTAMDAWIASGRWRVAIPALDRVTRGDETTPRAAQRGLPIMLLDRWLLHPFGGSTLLAVAGWVDDDGRVHPDPWTTSPPGSFVAWLRRGDDVEVRARRFVAGERTPGSGEAKIIARTWWFHRGARVGYVEGDEVGLGTGPDASIFPTRARYVSLDPPLTATVCALSTERLVGDAALPDATFRDPDATDEPAE